MGSGLVVVTPAFKSRNAILARMMGVLFSLYALPSASALADPQEIPLDAPWILEPPTTESIRWRGMLNREFGDVGSGTAVLYPSGGAGAAGFLVAVLAHGLISYAAQDAERKSEQDKADFVLEPYKDWIANWQAQTLWAGAISQGNGALANPDPSQATLSSSIIVKALPVITMAQDESAIVMDVDLELKEPAGGTSHPQKIRVVSSPLNGEPRQLWSAENGKRLLQTATAMFSHALLLARDNWSSTTNNDPSTIERASSTRTVRYLVGPKEQFERASILRSGCSRVILKTLRDVFMSAPVKPKLDSCTADPTNF